VIPRIAHIPIETPLNKITHEERTRLVTVLKGLPLHIKSMRPIDEAIVTAGGVELKEVDPRTMESKLVQGLFFAGEVLDIDAETGGFNLQAAFTTGYIAGQSAACG
jgi:predicted flavoprotein YhiN